MSFQKTAVAVVASVAVYLKTAVAVIKKHAVVTWLRLFDPILNCIIQFVDMSSL